MEWNNLPDPGPGYPIGDEEVTGQRIYIVYPRGRKMEWNNLPDPGPVIEAVAHKRSRIGSSCQRYTPMVKRRQIRKAQRQARKKNR